MDRYMLEPGFGNSGAYMELDEDGEWVWFDDVAALQARAEKAEAERDALRAALGQILTLDRGMPPEITDSALDAWWANLCAKYREIARAALNRETDT